MNKQELIEEIKKHAIYHCGEKECYKEGCTQVVDLGLVLGLVKQLDEPQPVKVPPFVADVIEGAREQSPELEDALHYTWGNGTKEFTEWYNKKSNRDLFARALLDGYEVEEERRYYVKITAAEQYLVRVEDENFLGFLQSRLRSKFTRKQLEDAGFGWVFDCPGIEIEEVE